MRIFNYLTGLLFALNAVQVQAQCAAAGSHYTASYPGGWVTADGDGNANLSYFCSDDYNGSIYLAGTAAYFYAARDGRELRVSRDIPVVDNTSWTMDFTVNISPSYYPGTLLKTNSPSVVLAALTSDNQSLQSNCSTSSNFCTSCGTYPNTNMDAVWVYLTSVAPQGCNENQSDKKWQIIAAARDGSASQNTSVGIDIPSTPGIYYIRLQRTGTGTAVVSVFSNSNFTGHLLGSPKCLSIPGSVTDLDVLTHEVRSQGICYRTFNGIIDNLKIDNGISCSQAPTPSFTAPQSLCGPQSFTVNGSGSTPGPLGISSYNWVVEECNASGNQFGPVWYGPGFSGAPAGNYTINQSTIAAAGVNMQCGHYYKVSLVVMNCGYPWTAVSKVIPVYCPPTIRIGGSQTICRGSHAGLSASITGGSGNFTMTWTPISPAGEAIYNGTPASITVAPMVTTTYQVTIQDNVTGCSATAQTVVNVQSLDAGFSLNQNASNSSYITVALTPNDLNGLSYPGFQYAYVIQELDANGNQIYAATSWTGTMCWWNYPSVETFKGFVSLPGGSYSLLYGNTSAGCGTAGQFLYDHTYRITRIVLNNLCPSKQVSAIVHFDSTGNMVVNDDPNAPDMTGMMAADAQQSEMESVIISPNPSSGIFTIDLGEEKSGAHIEVMNAFGETVKTIENTDGEQSVIDLTDSPKGMYMVHIMGNDGMTVSKQITLE